MFVVWRGGWSRPSKMKGKLSGKFRKGDFPAFILSSFVFVFCFVGVGFFTFPPLPFVALVVALCSARGAFVSLDEARPTVWGVLCNTMSVT